MFDEKHPAYRKSRLAVERCGDYSIDIELGHFDLSQRSTKPKRAVLLVHGAGAASNTFTMGFDKDEGGVSLVDHLIEQGFDPWLLDWRGGWRVTNDFQALLNNPDEAFGGSDEDVAKFSLAAAAKFDIPAALEHIHAQLLSADSSPQSIGIIGHCVGAAVVAHAIAAGYLEKHNVSHVVLSTIGLFWVPALDGQLKTQTRILRDLLNERAGATRAEGPAHFCIDPGSSQGSDDSAWPTRLQRMYELWSQFSLAHDDAVTSDSSSFAAQELCNRVSFLYGEPYRHGRLPKALHGSSTAAGSLTQYFGPIPLRLFADCADNIRRGWAAVPEQKDHRGLIADTARDNFCTLSSLGLLTGTENRLWHRESIDQMYEWLLRGRGWAKRKRFTKRVVSNYAHQDLLWCARAAQDDPGIFKYICDTLSA